MVKFINRFTGNAMFVAEDRVDEYKAAGHKLAEAKAEEKPVKKAAAAPKKATVKKTRR